MIVESKDHNKLFSDLQESYLETRNKKTLGEMYKVAYEYCCNLLIQYSHKKGIHWDDWALQEKAMDMASWLTEPYLRKPDFKIEKLSSYAHFAKLKILYRDADYEMKTTSYEGLVENGGDRYITETGEIIEALE